MRREDFDQLAAAGHTLVPVMRETYADLETPLTVYLKLANRPDSFLLESVVG
ncbi:MAG: anthranilate synthase component I, partial [Betaproteobacteria bacterium]|nr:anthranilate synthase component I [Betaproteobacteria bacterium]